MSFENLKAKSDPPISLKTHTDDCLRIQKELSVAFEQIYNVSGVPFFWETLRLAIIFHDLGKGHIEFQKLLKGEENSWNRRRHELFSLPFISGLSLDEQTKDLIWLIVAGHHKPFSLLKEKLNEFYSNSTGQEILLLIGENPITYEEDFKCLPSKEIMEGLERVYGIRINKEIQIENPIRRLKKFLYDSEDQRLSENWDLLLFAGAFKHSDHLASGFIKSIPILEIKDFDFLELTKFEPYEHQIKASQISGNAILTAPTGAGKTETAMYWLRKQIKFFGQGRIFYILPFTASINAMYERLNKEIGVEKQKVGMIHGKLNAYLDDYFEEYQYTQERKEKISGLSAKFRTLLTPLKVVTPFQLLKHLFGLKNFEKGLFEWVGAYFVFDEIHAYDAKVFAQILVLLEFLVNKMNAKIFIMTATLPLFLKTYIQESIGPHIEFSAKNSLYESFSRHQVFLLPGLLSESVGRIQSELRNGKKVLVVCNTVSKAQEVYERLKYQKGKAVLLHGRFNGKDRTHHEKTLKWGEKNKEIQLLVGTQAIEVSLDIDYDVIFSEPAPLDALIQRFGRVNRRRQKGLAPCYIFEKNNASDFFIYPKSVIQSTLEVLSNIVEKNNGVIEERKLQDYLNEIYQSWDEKSQKEFSDTYEYLNRSIQDLVPFVYDKTKESQFYEQFDGTPILPVELRSEFIQKLKEFDFIGANSLKVQIRKGKYAIWKREKAIMEDSFSFESNDRIIKIPFFLTNKKYSSDLGIIENKTVPWNDETVII